MGEIYWKLMEEIKWYTGLSPAAFFTILALTIFVYQFVSSMFVSPQDFNKPPTVPISLNNSTFFDNNSVSSSSKSVQVGQLTEQELRAFDGSDPTKHLLVSIKGQIYDVSSSRMFYGPGAPYSMFAGREASRALALLSFKPQDINGNIEGLSDDELVILQDWEYKFMDKYPKVGELVAKKMKNETSENEPEIPKSRDEEGHVEAQ